MRLRGRWGWAWVALVACNVAKPGERVLPRLGVDDATIDFGPIVEGQMARKSLRASNVGSVPLTLVTRLGLGSSSDVALDRVNTTLRPGASWEIVLIYTPKGAGRDLGTLIISTDDPEHGEVEIPIRAGPIGPTIEIAPLVIDFGPAPREGVARAATIKNSGSSRLNLAKVSIDQDANPDFTVRLPLSRSFVEPSEEVLVFIDYRPSFRAKVGKLVILSDDVMHPVQTADLLPDPLPACADAFDNDADRWADFPDDPGCDSPADDDELNPTECVLDSSIPCGTDVGECQLGLRVCTSSTWGPCPDDVRPTPELCDGLDNDCNGTDDDGIVETCVLNGCAGTRTCIAGGSGMYSDCLVSPEVEVCDGIDNDCNGTDDDNIPDLACGVGSCARVAAACPLSVPGACTPGAPVTETCNGLDDDCDGTPDNPPDLACGMGACRATVPACFAGTDNTCVAGTPSSEVCNGIDDNCDGPIDNLPALSCGIGPCRRTTPACFNGAVNYCVPGAPQPEVCNNADDNCDGTPDNTADLHCGTGACFRSVPGCVGGARNTCVPGTPVPEGCNSIDDNCDGTVDEGVCEVCGLMTTVPDMQEPNDSASAPNPIVPYPPGGALTYHYDVTLPAGDDDWYQYNFPPDGVASTGIVTAQILCVGWASLGCVNAPTVGMELWYYDDSMPNGRRISADPGQVGLATLTFVSNLAPPYPVNAHFRVRVYATSAVCAGEAANAHYHFTVLWN